MLRSFTLFLMMVIFVAIPLSTPSGAQAAGSCAEVMATTSLNDTPDRCLDYVFGEPATRSLAESQFGNPVGCLAICEVTQTALLYYLVPATAILSDRFLETPDGGF